MNKDQVKGRMDEAKGNVKEQVGKAVGNPNLRFFHARNGAYIQDDLRIRKGLTLSPGIRYSYQTEVPDKAAFEPRLLACMHGSSFSILYG